MRYFYLGNPIKIYFRFLVSISIALGYLGCGNSLIKNYRAVILY